MRYVVGLGYDGTENPVISVGSENIVSEGKKMYKLSLANMADMHVEINDNGKWLYIPANMGLDIDHRDAPIHSLKIQEDGIQYYWIGAYC